MYLSTYKRIKGGIQMSRFDDMRQMNLYQLRSFIRSNRGVNVSIMSGNYNEEQRLLASKVLYAKTRVKLISVSI